MSDRRGAGRHEPADASGFDGTVEIITIEPETFEEEEIPCDSCHGDCSLKPEWCPARDEGEVQHPGSGGVAPFRLEDEEEEDEEEGEDGAY